MNELALFAIVLIVGYFGVTTIARWLAIGAGFVVANWVMHSTLARVAIVGAFAYVMTEAGKGL